MNKRVLPAFIVASLSRRLGGGPDDRLRLRLPSRRPPRPQRSGAGRARAARCLFRHRVAARSEKRTRLCSITPLEPTTKASPS